jgi:hypothetical protein
MSPIIAALLLIVSSAPRHMRACRGRRLLLELTAHAASLSHPNHPESWCFALESFTSTVNAKECHMDIVERKPP